MNFRHGKCSWEMGRLLKRTNKNKNNSNKKVVVKDLPCDAGHQRVIKHKWNKHHKTRSPQKHLLVAVPNIHVQKLSKPG